MERVSSPAADHKWVASPFLLTLIGSILRERSQNSAKLLCPVLNPTASLSLSAKYCCIINKCNQCCIYLITRPETQLEGWMIWDRSMVAMNSSAASDANSRMADWNLPGPSAWGIPLPTLKWPSEAQVAKHQRGWYNSNRPNWSHMPSFKIMVSQP